ncbi:MAG: ABC transporter ATP-binding protein [Planctomycetes bacterium]|nr:ABC transporter ATP-binding protein [Planctomycetota bacterium]
MIEIRSLGKMYGRMWAVKDLSLSVAKGDIYGFIGPNGAGKTTTIRCLATLLKPSAGDATVCGHSIVRTPKNVRPLIGYMPDTFGVYEEMLVGEYLEFFAAAYKVPREARKKTVDDVLALTDLGSKRDVLIATLSRGMQQRLGLARVLVHNPEVLLLDEPASGLDPRARVEVRELVKELGRMGKTILVSSHILHELGDLCNKIAIIERGALLYAGPVAEAVQKMRGGTHVMVKVDDRPEQAADLLLSQPGVTVVQPHDGMLRVQYTGDPGDVWKLSEALIRGGHRLTAFHEEEVNLEDVFLRITKGQVS